MRGELAALPAGAATGAVDSPLGPFSVVCTANGLLAVRYPQSPPLAPCAPATSVAEALLAQALAELHGYFAGALRRFTVPLDLQGTAFQRAVWQAVIEVPFGETRGYGSIAAQLGRPAAARAVGHANGANPVPIVVPCHRLIGADGALRGYGGGLPIKRWLLDHEQALTPTPLPGSGRAAAIFAGQRGAC